MTVSVLIPLYNKAPYIENTIASVINQTWQGDIELVIYDDCSTDNGLEKAIAYTEANYKRGKVVIIRGEANRGTAFATNEADANASGDVRFLLGADDLCHPMRIEKQVEMLQATGALIVDSYIIHKDEKENVSRICKAHLPDAKRRMAKDGKNPMNGGTMAWRKELRGLMESKDGYFFNQNLRHAEDVEFATRAVAYTNTFSCPEFLYTALRNKDNKTNFKSTPPERVRDLAHIEKVRTRLFGSVRRKGGFFL